MSDDSARLDVVAEAMWHDQNEDPFSNADSRERGHYLRMAQAAIDALGLTQEWAVYSERNTRGETVHTQLSVESQAAAIDFADRLVQTFWRKHEGVSGAGILAPNPEVRSRLVSLWVRVDGGDA